MKFITNKKSCISAILWQVLFRVLLLKFQIFLGSNSPGQTKPVRGKSWSKNFSKRLRYSKFGKTYSMLHAPCSKIAHSIAHCQKTVTCPIALQILCKNKELDLERERTFFTTPHPVPHLLSHMIPRPPTHFKSLPCPT